MEDKYRTNYLWLGVFLIARRASPKPTEKEEREKRKERKKEKRKGGEKRGRGEEFNW